MKSDIFFFYFYIAKFGKRDWKVLFRDLELLEVVLMILGWKEDM